MAAMPPCFDSMFVVDLTIFSAIKRKNGNLGTI